MRLPAICSGRSRWHRKNMSLLRWIWAYLFDCVHSHTTWPHQNQVGDAYVCCLDCGREMPYSLEYMQIVGQTDRRARRASLDAPGEAYMSVGSVVARKALAGVMLMGAILGSQEKVNATDFISKANFQAQTACETEMLGN